MELPSRADQRGLRWFGHVERMDEYRMARRVLMAEVSGGRARGSGCVCGGATSLDMTTRPLWREKVILYYYYRW